MYELSLYQSCEECINIAHTEYDLVGYNAVQSVEGQPTFRILPVTCFQAGFLLSLFDSEDEGDIPPKCLWTFNGLHAIVPQKISYPPL
jgi:hypothetical protein